MIDRLCGERVISGNLGILNHTVYHSFIYKRNPPVAKYLVGTLQSSTVIGRLHYALLLLQFPCRV